ncbi:MAG: extracellular solute-binding protein, partial [Candidatus Eremiobacteraeota bacterium]|nr:extracellular solute-binding protein [Candidatus Eremiobacteraeota bacterium]
MSAKRLAATIAALGISVASLAACSSGPETGPSQSDDTGTTGDNQVFTVVQYEDPKSALVQGWQLAAEIFEDQHPGVTVDLQTTSFDSMQKNAKLLLSGNDVPDVVEVNLGNADAGQLASQGLIDPLTDEVTARGWDQKVTGAMQSLARYDERGLAGEGDWYGVPNIGQYVTVYYNKDMFEKAGIDSIPTNLDEFESMLGTLSATGVTPIASSASADQGFNQLWWWYSLVSARLDRQGADDYVLLDAPVNFNSQPWEDGTRQFQDWIDAGYFGNELGGLSFEQALVNFLSGNAAMYMWNFTAYNRIMDNPDFEAGFFTLPGSEMVLGNSGHLWSIPSASKNKDLAYDWI